MRTVSLYHRHRFPAEIISHCVWLYFRFALSFRDVEEMLAMRGVVLTYETVREWCLKFGQTYANNLRRRSPRPGDRWHLDEVFLKINGRIHYLSRAVDQDGDVLDILVQSNRDKKAAKKFFRKLLKGLRYLPHVIITDRLRSYGAAKAEVLPSVEHCQDKGQNNRAENSHQPTRLRERVMRRFNWQIRGEGRDQLSFADATWEMIGAWVTDLAISVRPGVLTYIYVHGIDATLERIVATGGEVVKPIYPEGDLWVATFRDPAGNVLGIWQQGPR